MLLPRRFGLSGRPSSLPSSCCASVRLGLWRDGRASYSVSLFTFVMLSDTPHDVVYTSPPLTSSWRRVCYISCIATGGEVDRELCMEARRVHVNMMCERDMHVSTQPSMSPTWSKVRWSSTQSADGGRRARHWLREAATRCRDCYPVRRTCYEGEGSRARTGAKSYAMSRATHATCPLWASNGSVLG